MSRLLTINASTTLVTEECCNCHVLFAMPKEMNDRLRAKPGTGFYCPAGHKQWYTGKSEEQKLREQLAAEEQRRDRAEARERVARRRAEYEGRRASAFKGQVTKVKRRVSKGVCPCCNRTFQDLARHMAGQHPDWAPDAEGGS